MLTSIHAENELYSLQRKIKKWYSQKKSFIKNKLYLSKFH